MKREKISVQVTEDVKSKIVIECQKTGKSQSQYVNELIAKGMENEKEVVLKKDLAQQLVRFTNQIHSLDIAPAIKKTLLEGVNVTYGNFKSKA